MGEGEGGGGQDEDLLVPPPLHPLPPKGGEIFGRICLTNCDPLVIFCFIKRGVKTLPRLRDSLVRKLRNNWKIIYPVLGKRVNCRTTPLIFCLARPAFPYRLSYRRIEILFLQIFHFVVK